MNEQIYEAEVCLPFYDTITQDVSQISFTDGSNISGKMYKLQSTTIKLTKEIEDEAFDYIGEGFGWKSSWLRNIRPLIQKRWRAEYGGAYYFIGSGKIITMTETFRGEDDYRYASHNYHQTREECQHALDLQTIENELVALIEELNAGRKIDWSDFSQFKYSLSYDRGVCQQLNTSTKIIHDKFYCIDGKLKEKAIQRIGKDRLEMYLRER